MQTDRFKIDLVVKAKHVASGTFSSQEQADVTKARVEQILDVLAKCWGNYQQLRLRLLAEARSTSFRGETLIGTFAVYGLIGDVGVVSFGPVCTFASPKGAALMRRYGVLALRHCHLVLHFIIEWINDAC